MGKVFLDVNVPMYAAGTQHRYKRPCAWIMSEVAEGRLEVATDAEAIQEVLYRYGAIKQWDIGAAIANDLIELVPDIYPVELDDVRLAVRLLKAYGPKGVTARDALHVAVMMNRNLAEILSTDAHFDLIGEITRLDPEDLCQQRK